MDVVVERCAGLDVHRDSVVATVRLPGNGKSRRRREQQTRSFGTTIGQLETLADWLEGFGVTLVGMEATGVYWKPVFWCWSGASSAGSSTLNAQHLHNVPGRKSDVIDSAWCCQLLEHGLVRPSFVPPPEIRRLRDLTRLCVAQTEERTRAIQRLEKVLQDAGIKLSSVASSTYSASARAMLEALLAGVSDPAELAELAKARLRAKIPRLQEALANRFELAHHGVLVAGLLAHIDSLDQAVATLDARIAAATQPHAELVELLCTIPGVNVNTARVLIAECGVDMSVFGSAEHLVSWAAICPGLNASGSRRRSGKTRHGNRWLRKALTEAARAAARSKNTYLASHYWQIRGRRGDAKAIGATRHDILVAYYHITRDRVPFRELGPDWLARRHSAQHRTHRLVRQLEALGHTVTLETTA
jgi:transposase